MESFTWNYFINSGDINAYLLYKGICPQESEPDELLGEQRQERDGDES